MRHSDTALALARGANAGGYHFGAVIFRRGDVISTGWCQEKSHPKQAHYILRRSKPYKKICNWLHAEVHALVSAKQDVSGCDIIVARWADGKLKNSAPCPACELALEHAGIRKIWRWSETEEAWVT